MRLHQRRRVDFRRGKRLGKDDILLESTKPAQRPETLSAEEFSALPATLTVRQIRLTPNIKGFRVQTIILVPRLLDPIAFPAEALGELFFQRWSVKLTSAKLSATPTRCPALPNTAVGSQRAAAPCHRL